MINYKKEKLIKKHLGINTPDWIVQNCIGLLNEFEDINLKNQEQALPIHGVSKSFYCIDEGVKGEGYLCDKQCDGCKRL